MDELKKKCHKKIQKIHHTEGGGTLTVCLEISHFSISNAGQEILQGERETYEVNEFSDFSGKRQCYFTEIHLFTTAILTCIKMGKSS